MELAHKNPNYWHVVKFVLIAMLGLNLLSAASMAANNDASVQAEFRTWAKHSLRPIASTELGAPKLDLRALQPMVRDAKIVALSELECFRNWSETH